MIHTMQKQVVTTNVRLQRNELLAFRAAAANEDMSFNQFALKALRAEATKQFFPQNDSTIKVKSAIKPSQKSKLTLRDLPQVFSKKHATGKGLTGLDAELYES